MPGEEIGLYRIFGENKMLTKLIIKYIKIIIIFFFLLTNKILAFENKIILKINEDIITTIDIFNEINTLKFLNKDLAKITNDQMYDIALQSLIKNTVKRIEVLKNIESMSLQNDDYLNSIIQNIYKKLNIDNLEIFKKELNHKGISFENFREKLKVDIFWNQIIYSKFNNKVVINEESLKKRIKNLENNYKAYNLSEIAYQVENVNEVDIRFKNIKNDIKNLGFENAALKHSSSDTSINGGNLGWISERSINQEILEIIKSTPINTITDPIRMPGGFLILKKNDEREIEDNLNHEEELKKLINYERDQQLKNYSNLYFNKVKKNLRIDEL